MDVHGYYFQFQRWIIHLPESIEFDIFIISVCDSLTERFLTNITS